VIELSSIQHSILTTRKKFHLLQMPGKQHKTRFIISRGSKIQININTNSCLRVSLSIKDNGIGMPGDRNKTKTTMDWQ